MKLNSTLVSQRTLRSFPFINHLAVVETQLIKPSAFNQMQTLVSLERQLTIGLHWHGHSNVSLITLILVVTS